MIRHQDGAITRRTLLRAGVAVGSIAAATAVGLRLRQDRSVNWDVSVFPPPGDASVVVASVTGYDADLEMAVLDALRAIGADVAGRSVVLKPNLVEFDPGTVINTDPRVVAAAVLAFRRLGAASVTVAEGPGHRRDTMYVVERTGLGDVLRDLEVPFVDLNVDAVRPVRIGASYTALGELWLPRTITEADVVVSMPKMKMHHWAGVTLSLKNCFGCVPARIYGWPKNVLHFEGIERSILDVAAAVRPELAIVDGIVAMEGNGPISGEPVSVGALVVGDDPVATDVVAATIMGVDPASVPYLAEAGRFLGQGDMERIDHRGELVAAMVTPLEPAPGFSEGGSDAG